MAWNEMIDVMVIALVVGLNQIIISPQNFNKLKINEDEERRYKQIYRCSCSRTKTTNHTIDFFSLRGQQQQQQPADKRGGFLHFEKKFSFFCLFLSFYYFFVHHFFRIFFGNVSNLSPFVLFTHKHETNLL